MFLILAIVLFDALECWFISMSCGGRDDPPPSDPPNLDEARGLIL